MVLMAATGFTDRVIAQELDVGAPRVRRWVARYVRLGLTGLEKDAPRGGPPRLVSAQRVIELTTQTQPEAATHWSTRTMAKEAGARAATISRIWRSHGLKPHLSKAFKVSNDIRFEEKLTDIVGLYMNPSGRWYCAATRRARCKHGTEHNQACRSNAGELRP
jgi:transposase